MLPMNLMTAPRIRDHDHCVPARCQIRPIPRRHFFFPCINSQKGAYEYVFLLPCLCCEGGRVKADDGLCFPTSPDAPPLTPSLSSTKVRTPSLIYKLLSVDLLAKRGTFCSCAQDETVIAFQYINPSAFRMAYCFCSLRGSGTVGQHHENWS